MPTPLVLVAEDLEDDYLILERAFRKAEIAAVLHWAQDGRQAQAYLKGEGKFLDRGRFPMPVLILADLKMPAVDGFDLLKWIKVQPYLRRIPVVVLTGSNQPPDINQAYDLGASSYLVKPHGFEDMLKLSTALKRYWLTLNERADTLAPTDTGGES